MTALRKRMTEDMQVRNLSPHTQASYLQQVSLFARHFSKSPDALGPEHIRTYQIYLTNERKLAPNSIHTAVAALRFLYKVTLKRDWTFGEVIPLPKKPQKLPVVLSPEEVAHFLGCVDCSRHRVILTICYAAGLRISEAVRLKAIAVDSQRMVIRVEQGKGRKDRYVMLSPKLLNILRRYWKVVHPKSWPFPGSHTDQPITKDAVEAACQKAHHLSGLSKPVTPHSLRHAFAVHLLESGAASCDRRGAAYRRNRSPRASQTRARTGTIIFLPMRRPRVSLFIFYGADRPGIGAASVTGRRMTPTIVFDTYWRFAAERLAMYYRRLADPIGSCTADPILSGFRFTNTYRAADRVSQYLISEVQAGTDRSQEPREVFFRTILFKIFNRIETWEALEQHLGPITWAKLDAAALDRALENLRRRGNSIYSAAYIMPSPSYGRERKHSNHIALLLQMMKDRLPERIKQAPSLRTVYSLF